MDLDPPPVHQSASHGSSRSAASTVGAVVVPATAAVACRRPAAVAERPDRLAFSGKRQPKAIVGSSLGGFDAVVLARRLRCLAVLVNPAVHAARDLA